jgi:hypothetical protein
MKRHLPRKPGFYAKLGLEDVKGVVFFDAPS